MDHKAYRSVFQVLVKMNKWRCRHETNHTPCAQAFGALRVNFSGFAEISVNFLSISSVVVSFSGKSLKKKS